MTEPLNADAIKNRSCGATCQQILPLIPDEHPMKAEMKSFVRSCFIELPEDGFRWWKEASLIMSRHVDPDSDEQWQKDVCAIWFRKTAAQD